MAHHFGPPATDLISRQLWLSELKTEFLQPGCQINTLLMDGLPKTWPHSGFSVKIVGRLVSSFKVIRVKQKRGIKIFSSSRQVNGSIVHVVKKIPTKKLEWLVY